MPTHTLGPAQVAAEVSCGPGGPLVAAPKPVDFPRFSINFGQNNLVNPIVRFFRFSDTVRPALFAVFGVHLAFRKAHQD